MDKGNRGFIKLDRLIFEHWIYQDAEKFQKFVDLIQLMRWKDETLLIGNKTVTIPRGSYYTSEIKLGERWGWSRKKVRTYLLLLEKEGMLTKNGTPNGTTLTIVNYEVYQGEGTTKSTTEDTTQGTTEDTSEEQHKVQQRANGGYTKEEIKEINKNSKEIKEKKEGEDKPPTLPPLSSLTGFRKAFLDQFKEIAYRTWIEPCEVNEADNKIIIRAPDDFKKTYIESKYKQPMELLCKKSIDVLEC
ncbi:DnaA N-terminal domain-containing protein [Clostridium sp. 'White wine YQ']|uniref:DnaA N-terminal domain-containing protein n=1 Tax=Clostridium sp. 'White wine YQ' TaxID=3027474 RepID=UPI0023662BF5|nr:DnaA N-terminal domain-containing protein [Clostridium sp. 'White wine YQ']MDD7793671.1 DnaA N-terminal domain-containing protein [Clostridium sp. 'White wine YQ']